MNREQSPRVYTLEERRKIIMEYESGVESKSAVVQKYGLSSSAIIRIWRSRMSKMDKSITFTPSKETSIHMGERSTAELEAEIARLQRELEWSRLETKALNTLIDIAERDGIQIRKKSGAKQ